MASQIEQKTNIQQQEESLLNTSLEQSPKEKITEVKTTSTQMDLSQESKLSSLNIERKIETTIQETPDIKDINIPSPLFSSHPETVLDKVANFIIKLIKKLELMLLQKLNGLEDDFEPQITVKEEDDEFSELAFNGPKKLNLSKEEELDYQQKWNMMNDDEES